jgi:hypothetical protein
MGQRTYPDVIGGELPEMGFLEDDAVRLSESEGVYITRYQDNGSENFGFATCDIPNGPPGTLGPVTEPPNIRDTMFGLTPPRTVSNFSSAPIG